MSNINVSEARTEQNYTKEASDLLQQMGVKFSARFIQYGAHFNDDKESRDIFRVSFSRGRNRFSLRFGQSLKDSDGGGGTPPTAYDVICCLQRSDVGSFNDFCNEFGYDFDSRKAEKTYFAVVKEYNKVQRFFTQSEIEQLQEII